MHGAINGSPGLTLESLRFEQMLRRIRNLARRRPFCYAPNRYLAAFATLLVVILLLRSEQMLRRIRDLARRRPFCYARFRSWLRALFAKANCREKLLAVQQPIRRLAYI